MYNSAEGKQPWRPRWPAFFLSKAPSLAHRVVCRLPRPQVLPSIQRRGPPGRSVHDYWTFCSEPSCRWAVTMDPHWHLCATLTASSSSPKPQDVIGIANSQFPLWHRQIRSQLQWWIEACFNGGLVDLVGLFFFHWRLRISRRMKTREPSLLRFLGTNTWTSAGQPRRRLILLEVGPLLHCEP